LRLGSQLGSQFLRDYKGKKGRLSATITQLNHLKSNRKITVVGKGRESRGVLIFLDC